MSTEPVLAARLVWSSSKRPMIEVDTDSGTYQVSPPRAWQSLDSQDPPEVESLVGWDLVDHRRLEPPADA